MFTLGITGGIGSGKSTVADMFSTLGIYCVDADTVAREVVQPESPCLEEIAKHFGTKILNTNGTLNRALLREIIFNVPDEKQWLEHLTHPEINRLLRLRLEQASSPYRILVTPLLFEKQQQPMVDRILVVDIPETVQLARSSHRDKVAPASIKAIMKAQVSREVRIRSADDIVDNSQGLKHTEQQVLKLHRFYLSLP